MTKRQIGGVAAGIGFLWMATAIVVAAGATGGGKSRPVDARKPAASPSSTTNVTVTAAVKPAPIPSAVELAALQKRYLELFDQIRELNKDLSFARRNLNNDKEVAAARQAVLTAQQAYDGLVDQKIRANPETARMLLKLQVSILEQQRIVDVLSKAREAGTATNAAPKAPPLSPGHAAAVPVTK